MQISHLLLRTFCLLLVAISLLMPQVLSADSGKRILSIEVSGNRYVESAAVVANIESRTGELLSRKQISHDVRSLFKTGYFEDVHVEGVPGNGGIHLIYIVKENPLIAELSIHGNDEIVDKKLKPKLKLKPGRVFSAATFRRDRNAIRKAYLKKGYYQVEVTAEKVLREDGRVDLTLNVHEGDVTHIKRIQFIGNNAFSDKTLRDELASKQSSFASWFSDRDVFDRERFGADGQMLQQYYMNHGYLDVKIESAQISLTPDKESFYLTFSLFEGPQYTIDQIDLQGDLVPSREALMESIELKKEDIYSVTELRKSIEAMEQAVGDKGYAFASVTPLFKRDVESQRLSITFDIEKGREVYIERIEITGNMKTEDRVIRRELRQHEGERYSASRVKRSKERLNRTQLFKDVRVNLNKSKADDRVQMDISVEEDKTGSFSAGAGFSQAEKIFLTGNVQERNFLGKGYNVSLSADIGGVTQNYNATLSDPYFLDTEVGASVNLFKTQTELDSILVSSYKQDDYGGGIGFAIPLSEFMAYSIGYRYNRTNITNIAPGSSLLLFAQEGVQTTGEMTQGLSWDTRNRTAAPTEGHLERLTLSVAGLGGINKFYEASISSKSYFLLGDTLTLNPNISVKYISGFAGESVPIYRRYSMGGIGSLRGFNSYGVSLRDPATGEAIGGDKEIMGSINLFFPMPYMETGGFRGVLFLDAGTTWGEASETVAGVNFNVSEKFSFSKIRTSVGFGVEWMSPVGPLTLAWAFPINTVAGDVEKSFDFALGMSF